MVTQLEALDAARLKRWTNLVVAEMSPPRKLHTRFDPDRSSRLGRRCYSQYVSELWPTFQEATVQKIFLAGIAAAGLLSGSALASDLPAKAPVYTAPIAPPPYNWSGLYVGANFGGGWSNGSLNIPGNNLYGGLSEFIGGVQAGYNFQAGHFLFGVEGEFDGAGFAHPVLPAPTLGLVDQRWIGTVAGRVGLVNDRWLLFAKLGGGWVNSNATLNLPGTVWNGSSTSSGWLAGAGIEYGFKSHWTVKLEYDYLGLSNWNSPTVPAVALNRDLQMVKAGINYKFQSGLPATAEARAKHSHEPSKMKTYRSNHKTRSRIWSACRSRATPISTLGHSVAPRKYSTFSPSCRCT